MKYIVKSFFRIFIKHDIALVKLNILRFYLKNTENIDESDSQSNNEIISTAQGKKIVKSSPILGKGGGSFDQFLTQRERSYESTPDWVYIGI